MADNLIGHTLYDLQNITNGNPIRVVKMSLQSYGQYIDSLKSSTYWR